MAAPTLAQLRATARAWWRLPGRPRLDVLRAMIASLWTDSRCSVRIEIVNNAGTWSVVATLETRNVDGTVASTVTRTWTPESDDMQARIEQIADVMDDTGTTPRERGEV